MKYLSSFLLAVYVLFFGPAFLCADEAEMNDFRSGYAVFNNYHEIDEDSGFEYWHSFAYSNRTDTSLTGMAGQYTAVPGEGAMGTSVYGVVHWSSFSGVYPTIIFDSETVVNGAYFTNNMYAYDSMTEGDDFTDPFDEDDWLEVTVTGLDAQGNETGSVSFYLAENGFIQDQWKWVNLDELNAVKSLKFSMASSDTGEWGMNTPAYFCIDGIDDQIYFADLSLESESYWNGESPDDSDDTDDSDDSSSDTCFISSLKGMRK